MELLHPIGFEPMTFCLSNKRSNLLSYGWLFGGGRNRTYYMEPWIPLAPCFTPTTYEGSRIWTNNFDFEDHCFTYWNYTFTYKISPRCGDRTRVNGLKDHCTTTMLTGDLEMMGLEPITFVCKTNVLPVNTTSLTIPILFLSILCNLKMTYMENATHRSWTYVFGFEDQYFNLLS